VGAAGYNDRLSMRRAQAVLEALVASGLTRHSVELRAFGDSHPVADNKTAPGRAENRRVAIVVPVE
jgi:outer membrane protein OmpA-like peptidoglycan-associated protein